MHYNSRRAQKPLLAGSKACQQGGSGDILCDFSVYRRIPVRLRYTLTLDNGKEFARFHDIEKNSGLKIYFADPYSAWQRGTNENTNGSLRRYFPKGTDFGAVAEKALVEVVKKLNHRPRKCLDYRTPHEVFKEACCGAVAM